LAQDIWLFESIVVGSGVDAFSASVLLRIHEGSVNRHSMAVAVGGRVLIKGLQGRPELNGLEAKVKSFVAKSGRWEVVLQAPDFAGQRICCKPENVEAIPPAADAEDEVDDLDDLIADSLGGVQSAHAGEKQAAKPAAEAAAPQTWAKEAVRELKEEGARAGGEAGEGDFLSTLVKTLQDESFQKELVAEVAAAKGGGGEAASGSGARSSKAGGAAASSSSSAIGPALPPAGDAAAEDVMQNLLKSFSQVASGEGGDFEKGLETLMTSMMSPELLTDPIKKLVGGLEDYLKGDSAKGASQEDITRYENQLRVYNEVLRVYRDASSPLPDIAREEVTRLLQEIQTYGQPPEEVQKLASVPGLGGPDGPDGDNFEEFAKALQLSEADQDLVKRLQEDPEELTKALGELTQNMDMGGMAEEACKQQ